MKGVVYLIESLREYETVYKIGFTRKSSKKRSKQLQTGTDGELKVIDEFHSDYVNELEKALHGFYSHRNIQNEWFKLNLDDVFNFQKMCHKIENNIMFLNDNKI